LKDGSTYQFLPSSSHGRVYILLYLSGSVATYHQTGPSLVIMALFLTKKNIDLIIIAVQK
jgi:hypothetical protein